MTVYDPKQAAVSDAKTDAVIDYAKRVKDWPTLETAIDRKLEDQEEFLRLMAGDGGRKKTYAAICA